MIKAFFHDIMGQNLPYRPLEGQKKLLNRLADFLFEADDRALFLLKGYAGTGKTSLVGALVKAWLQLEQKVVLLAPTGRAAKVFSAYASHPAFTIHKKIYRQRAFSASYDGFLVSDNLHKDTLFIVDEASMIANYSGDGQSYGSGCLLDDLVEYVYAGTGCRLLILGDSAQLPPMGQLSSPALDALQLGGYGLDVELFELDEVARQMADSGILANATYLRQLMEVEPLPLPKLSFASYTDIIDLSGEELVEAISDSYDREGIDQTIVITRSNKRANTFNQGIRNQILYREEELVVGDMLIVGKNNYFWCKDYKEIDFIANGDVARVVRVRGYQELYGCRFADLLLAFPDYGVELEAKVMLNTLTLDTPALTAQQNNELFCQVMADYPEITNKSALYKKMKEDPYFNALQVKYAYAVTCHKAQGGQWSTVFLDLGYLNTEMLNTEFYRWLYTAVTRATHRLYIINTPKELRSEAKTER